VDEIPPTAPTNLRVVTTSTSNVTLEWDPSTDDVGVYKYEIYRDGQKALIVEGTQATVFNLNPEQVYRFYVKASDLTGNLSPASEQVVAPTVLTGLSYKYYEGTWNVLPDFNSLTPVKIGRSDNIDISVREQNDNFAFFWEGNINIPVAGDYTFETRSDDGSKLYIGSYDESNLVVDNDGLHGNRYRSGTINFPVAGAYPIVITFFEKGGGQNMQIFWRDTAHGVGGRQEIPDEVFKDNFVFPGTPPAAPTSISATTLSYDQIQVDWTDASDNETEFQVFRSSGSSDFAPAGIVPAGTESFVDTNLEPSTDYGYQVIALGQYGNSGSPVSPFQAIGDINHGIGARDNASGTGWILFSVQNVFDRFSPNPHSSNSDHLIAVRYHNGGWQYNNNNNFYSFTPAEGDVLLATVNYSSDQIASLEGVDNVVNGIEEGFASGDLTFLADWWNGGPNNGEFTIEGTYFERNNIEAAYATTDPLPPLPVDVSDLTATGTATSSIALSWTDNSNNEDGFKIYRSTGNNTSYILIDTVGSSNAGLVEWENINLFAHTEYYYRVVPFNVAGESAGVETSASTLNDAPQLSPELTLLSVRYGSPYELHLFAEDLNGDPIHFSSPNLPAFGSITDYGDGTALLLLNTDASDEGIYQNIIIQVSDDFGGVTDDVFDINVNDNNVPELQDIADVIMSEGSSETIVLNGSDIDGTENLEWSLSPELLFATLTPSLDGTATLDLDPTFDDAGVYDVTVRLADEFGAFVTKSFNLTVNDTDPNTTVLFNVSKNSLAPSPWNNAAKDPVEGDHFQNLIDTNGQPTTFGVLVNSQFGWNTAGFGAQTGNNSGFVPDNVAEEYWWFGNWGVPEVVSLQLTGLSPANAYNIQIFASSVWRGPADNGSTIYTIEGTSKELDVEGNTQNFVEFNGISPEANGTIDITLSEGATALVGYINAMIITEIFNDGNPPRAPFLTSVDLDAESNATINWNDESYNENGFEVYRSENGGMTFTALGVTEGDQVSFSDTGLPENTTVTYAVKSFNGSGFSDFSNTIDVNIDAVPPVINAQDNYTVDAGGPEVVQITASDQSSVTFSFENLPAFVTPVDNLNGTADLQINASLADRGVYPGLRVIVEDALGAISSKEFDLTISDPRISSISFNFNLHNAEGSPWNNLNRNPSPFDRFDNLYNNKGDLTGIYIDYNSGYRGEIVNEGATTGDNSGVVPDNVLSEYLWFGAFGAPETLEFTISNLDPTKLYNVNFIGSSVWTGVPDNGSTLYTIGGETVSLDVQGNTQNSVSINAIQPDANNEITFTTGKGVDATVGYINGLIIQEYDNSYLPAPSNLRVSTLSSTALELDWADNSGNETGFEIYEGPDGSSLSLLTTVPANSTSYTHGSLVKGSAHYYQIRAVNPEGQSDFSEVVSGATEQFAVYLNFNNTDNQQIPNGNVPFPWNNIDNLPTEGVGLVNLVNADGLPTGIDVMITQSFEGDFPDGQTTGDDSGVFPDNALAAHFYVFPTVQAAVEFRNLPVNFLYNVEVIGSWQSNCTSDYTIGNETLTLHNYQNVSNTVKFIDIEPDQLGKFVLTVDAANGSPAGVINALKITAKQNVNAPASARIGSDELELADIGLSTLQDLKLYPNPVADSDLTIMFNSSENNAVKLRIVDMVGNVVIEEEHYVRIGSNSLTTAVNALNNGLYLVQLESNNYRSDFIRIIKQ